MIDQRPLNCFSVDVEDYFQVEAFSRDVPRDVWPTLESRVVDNTKRLLDLVAEYGVRGTFFVLGWVAERYPKLVAEIRAAGHELGCHSYWHRLIYSIDPHTFREDTRSAKAAIEDAAGVAISCYRAPTFSITRRCLWALDVLAECGFTHDSSIFPILHDNYGMPGTPRHPYIIRSDGTRIVEFPISSFRALGATLPVAGGGYLRMLPLWYNRFGIGSIAREGKPAMVYVHPWEIDPGQPRIKARWKSRVRHYSNLAGMAGKLKALLGRYRFAPMSEVVASGPLPEFVLDRAQRRLTPVGA